VEKDNYSIQKYLFKKVLYLLVYTCKYKYVKHKEIQMPDIFYNIRCSSDKSREYLRRFVKLEAAKRGATQEQILVYAMQFLQAFGERFEKEHKMSYDFGNGNKSPWGEVDFEI
jgi:hypothetical protein